MCVCVWYFCKAHFFNAEVNEQSFYVNEPIPGDYPEQVPLLQIAKSTKPIHTILYNFPVFHNNHNADHLLNATLCHVDAWQIWM